MPDEAEQGQQSQVDVSALDKVPDGELTVDQLVEVQVEDIRQASPNGRPELAEEAGEQEHDQDDERDSDQDGRDSEQDERDSDQGGSSTQETEAIEVVQGEVEGVAEEESSDVPAETGGDDIVNYEDQLVEVLPGLARAGIVVWARGAVWSFRASFRFSLRLARAAVDPRAAAGLAQEVRTGMRAYAREFLGISDLEERVHGITPVGTRFSARSSATLTRGQGEQGKLSPRLALRAQGAELLRQSADVSSDEDLHPAFGRVLRDLAPDEGRILRLLAYEGPQPVVDVRASSLIGVGSQLVESNLNMVGMQAGVRYDDRMKAYLGNLQRLGLICFSDEPLDDAIAYQVLEAQPHVLRLLKDTSRARSVQRTLRLTEFGEEFCHAAFPQEIDEVKQLAAGEVPEGEETDGDSAEDSEG